MLFREVAEYFDKIESTASRIEMTEILAELIEKIPASESKKIIYLLQGKIAPSFEGKEIGFGEKLIMEAIARATGYTREEIEKKFNEKGDLGITAEEFTKKKKQISLFTENLTIEKVFSNYKKISTIEGQGSVESKIKLMAELFNSANPKEAKYIARIPLGNIRLGIGDPTIMDSFSIIFAKKILSEKEKNKQFLQEIEKNLKEKNPEKRKEELLLRLKQRIREKIEEAYNIHSDLGEIGELLKKNGLNGLSEVKIIPGTPIRPAAAERLTTAEEIIKKIGKCAVEAKYDGFRMQISKNNDEVKIFSRQNEEITSMFPEIIEAVKKQLKPKKCIVEGEALAVNQETNEYYPFQITIQRKRKYDVEKKAKEYPLNLFLFDVMFVDGENLMNKPFIERRKKLEEILKSGEVIKLSEIKIVEDPKSLEEFFEEKISQGLEGIIAKDLNAPYTAGARKYAWIKMKRSYKGSLQDTVDLTIIGYYKGKGKRTQFGLGALLVGAYNDEKDVFESVAKIGTGMSEEMLKQLEEMLSKITLEKKPARIDSEIEPDFWVEPKYVIEVRADEITTSPLHSCCKTKGKGFALRFPRMISIRSDKKPEDSTTSKEIQKMFENQKRVSIENPYSKE